LAAVEAAGSTFPGGVHYIDLQQAEGVGDVCRKVATPLRLGDEETRVGLRIDMALQSPAGRSVLVLDNRESARDGVRGCIDEWRERAENLQLVATSRVPLDAKDEVCFQLKPLPTPRAGKDVLRTPADAEKFDSVMLFIASARESDRNFTL